MGKNCQFHVFAYPHKVKFLEETGNHAFVALRKHGRKPSIVCKAELYGTKLSTYFEKKKKGLIEYNN